jgi:hypothetical protein
MNATPFTIPFTTNPLPWVVLGGLFAGAAVSRLTMRWKNRPHPERARTRKWVWVCIYLSLAVVSLLLALFVPGPSKIQDVRLLYAGGAAFVVAFAFMRFKRSVGIPVTVLAVASIVLLGLFLQSVRAFTGETEIAVVRVIGLEQDRMKLELQPVGGAPVLLNMEGNYFAPIVKTVIFDDLYVFLGVKSWYRFVGMTSFTGKNGTYRQGNTDYYFPQPTGISEGLWKFYEKNESMIPGVKTAQVSIDLKQPREFGTYGIRMQNDGGVEIVARSD